jgi:hypothetical protein
MLYVVGFDTLVRCAGYPVGAELDSGANAAVMEAFDILDAELGGVVCIACDHPGKDVSRGPSGSGRKSDISDFMFELSKAPRKLIIRKMSDGEDGLSFPMSLDKADGTSRIAWGAQKQPSSAKLSKGGQLLATIRNELPPEQVRAAFYGRYGSRNPETLRKAFIRAAKEIGLEVEDEAAQIE